MSEQAIFADLPAGWENYQNLLVKAVRPLTADQLALHAGDLRTIGQIAAHIADTRAGWLRQALGEGGPELDAIATWDEPGAPARSAAELVQGLETTWQVLKDGLARWTPAYYAETVEGVRRGRPWKFRRGWVVWHLLEHDLHHGGELSLLLGLHGLAGVSI